MYVSPVSCIPRHLFSGQGKYTETAQVALSCETVVILATRQKFLACCKTSVSPLLYSVGVLGDLILRPGAPVRNGGTEMAATVSQGAEPAAGASLRGTFVPVALDKAPWLAVGHLGAAHTV